MNWTHINAHVSMSWVSLELLWCIFGWLQWLIQNVIQCCFLIDCSSLTEFMNSSWSTDHGIWTKLAGFTKNPFHQFRMLRVTEMKRVDERKVKSGIHCSYAIAPWTINSLVCGAKNFPRIRGDIFGLSPFDFFFFDILKLGGNIAIRYKGSVFIFGWSDCWLTRLSLKFVEGPAISCAMEALSLLPNWFLLQLQLILHLVLLVLISDTLPAYACAVKSLVGTSSGLSQLLQSTIGSKSNVTVFRRLCTGFGIFAASSLLRRIEELVQTGIISSLFDSRWCEFEPQKNENKN